MSLCRSAIVTAVLVPLVIAFAVNAQQPRPQGSAGPPDQPPAAQNPDQWMQLKLRSTQEILSGLTHGDFKTIEDNARRMLVLNVLEQWLRDRQFKQKSEYEGQLNAFEFSTKELIRRAEDKNIDGALDAYVLLTRSCVECHKLIRDAPAGK